MITGTAYVAPAISGPPSAGTSTPTPNSQDGTTALISKFNEDSGRGGSPSAQADMLRHYIQQELAEMKRFRDYIKFTYRLDACLRQREGAYDPAQAADIAAFGGSAVYARLTTNKIRAGAAMLRSIFVQGERPWDLTPTPVPTLPDDINQAINQVIQVEVQNNLNAGVQTDQGQIQQRMQQLQSAALEAARKKAGQEALKATQYVDDILTEGNFYVALNEFILDFCTLPMAVMKGPLAIMKTGIEYQNGKPARVRKPVLTFQRVDPYDFMWSPGTTTLEDANIIERMKMSRADVSSLMGLDGYDEDAIRSVLREYGESGYHYVEFKAPVRDDVQSQQDEWFTNLIDVLAYNGRMSGADLILYGIAAPAGETFDPDMEYTIQAWVSGQYVLKVQIDPDPSNRIAYYAASYEPVSGSIVGTALPELIADIQETYNATLRSLINNIAISSGPLVGVNQSRWLPPADGQVRITPWSIWRFESDPTANAGEKPIEFWQANLNAQELMGVLTYLQNVADDISGIPRYLSGSNVGLSGAGRTSSGLSMLMSNATRTMTSVAGEIDQKLLMPLLEKTYNLIMLTTGTDILRGDENIDVKGATYAETKDNDRMRLIEFAQMTQNPIDMQIMGLPGRATLLRNISRSLIPNEEIIPSEEDMEMMQQRQQMQAQLQAAAGGQPGQEGPQDQMGDSGPEQDQQAQGMPNQPRKPQPQKSASANAARQTDNMHRTRSPNSIRRAA